MTIMRDEIPFVNSGILQYIDLAKKRMNEIEKFHKEYLSLKKRIKIANDKLDIHKGTLTAQSEGKKGV